MEIVHNFRQSDVDDHHGKVTVCQSGSRNDVQDKTNFGLPFTSQFELIGLHSDR